MSKDDEHGKEEEFDDISANREVERQKLLQRLDAGFYMQDLRGDRSLSQVARDIGMSSNYVSHVEKGRLPSDHYLQVIADYYSVDEDELFMRWGKTPILTRETVRSSNSLQKTIAQIGRDKSLSDEEKNELYDEMYQTYQRYLKRKEARGE
ncbi:MAG: helix-turn-helix transcriptional regulator [Desulfosporosinus sp.]|nr:helix-turn-helix transcriptional regulator [Desulfosporosinus sp.]